MGSPSRFINLPGLPWQTWLIVFLDRVVPPQPLSDNFSHWRDSFISLCDDSNVPFAFDIHPSKGQKTFGQLQAKKSMVSFPGNIMTYRPSDSIPQLTDLWAKDWSLI
jgi:hypothetical protein